MYAFQVDAYRPSVDRISVRGGGGLPPPCRPPPSKGRPHYPPWTEKHLWNHYHPHTSYAVGNYAVPKVRPYLDELIRIRVWDLSSKHVQFCWGKVERNSLGQFSTIDLLEALASCYMKKIPPECSSCWAKRFTNFFAAFFSFIILQYNNAVKNLVI